MFARFLVYIFSINTEMTVQTTMLLENIYLTNLIKELKKFYKSKFKMYFTCIKLNAKKITTLQKVDVL